MRISTARTALGCVLCALVAFPVSAQQVGGPGSVSLGPLDTEAGTGGLSNLGVQYSPATNTLFITGRGSVVAGVYSGNPPHTLYEIDFAGTLVNSYQQPNMTSVWGHRDGATDGNLLFFGDDQGVYCFDPMAGAYQASAAVMAMNGPQVVNFPIPKPAALPTVRALAYNPAGNGGNGSFWAGDFAMPLIEFNLSGTVLTTHANTSGWSLYGLAWDPIRGRLWGSTLPNQGALVELNPVTGMQTGVSIPRVDPAAPQGGCCWMQRPGGGMGGAVPYSELLVLHQGAPDAITGYRIDLYNPAAGRGHWDEIRLQTAVNSGGFSIGSKLFTDGDNLSWKYAMGSQAASLPLLPGLLFLAVGTDADVMASTLGLPEFVIPNMLSTPASGGLSFVLGDGFGFGGLFAPVIGPIGPNVTTGPAVMFGPWPAGGPLSPGQSLRLQAFIPDNGIYGAANPFGGYATNSAVLTYRTPGCDGTTFEGVPVGAGNYPTGWTNGPGGTATDQWQPIIGSTPSGNTGASSAYSGQTYMYCETTGAQNTWPKVFVMDTAPLNTCGSSSPMLTFAYHMWGGTMGTLMVEQIDSMGMPTATVFTISGDQGNMWHTASVPVTPGMSGTVRLRFTGTSPSANNSWQSDFCLDDVFIQ